MKLLASADNRRFFLVPDGLALGRGDLELKSMSGERFSVSAAVVSAYEVPELVAKAYAEQAVSAMGAELVDMQVKLSEGMARAQAELRKVTAQAGLGDDPRQVLGKLGIDPTTPPEQLLVKLAEIARKIGEQAPKVVEGTMSAQDALANLDETLGGGGSGKVEALLNDLAKPSNSPELQEAARRVAELQRKLREG